VILLLSSYSKKHYSGYSRDTCTLIFILALFTITKLWKYWVWRTKELMSEYSIPLGQHYDSCFLRRSCKSAFLHPEEEIQDLIDLPQG
jgi:hypothetical protein